MEVCVWPLKDNRHAHVRMPRVAWTTLTVVIVLQALLNVSVVQMRRILQFVGQVKHV